MSTSQIDIIIQENLKTMRELPDKQYGLVLNIGNKRIEARAVPSRSCTENYLDDAFAVNTLTAVFLPSEVTNWILPNANKLEGTVLVKDKFGVVRTTHKYRMVLVGAGDAKLANNDDRSSDVRELDRVSLSAVTFQYMDHATFDLMMAQTGAIMPKTTPLNALLTLLSQHQLTNEYGQADAVAGFDVSPGALEEPTTVVVRDGTPLRSASKLIHEKYGIYPNGCSCFLKDKVWYVFAPYSVVSEGDLTKNHRLVVIRAPSNRYGNIAKNIRTQGTTTTIIATGESSHNNTSDTDALNGATGVMHADATKLLGNSMRQDSGKMSNAEEYMTEYSAKTYRGKENNIAVPHQAFVTNPHKYTSMMSSKAGDIVEVVWENGDITKLKPGCAVTFITQDEKAIRTLYGTLLGAASFTSIPDKGIVERVHQENVSLTLFLKRSGG